jgi:hypothetical protein
MKGIGNYLERFKNLKAPKRTVRDALVKAVDDVVGIKVSGEIFKIQPAHESEIFIQAQSVIKQSLFEYQHDILNNANSILGRVQLRQFR